MAQAKEKQLVIVESPAKAKTISQFLDKYFVVDASFGHVRDLPNNAAEVPANVKKEPWSRLGVNIDAGFEPLYIIPADKKKHVSNLKSALKDVGVLLLATDEDREGESISWHLLKVLKPSRTVAVKRIVFHEITREAITTALQNPREVNNALVRAQESRRILDRLYGYTLSPLLWKKVAPGLSAGRVQSVATRLIVDRERLRRQFVSSEFWKLTAELSAFSGTFKANLVRVDGARVAAGRSFDANTGALKEKKHVVLDEQAARTLESRLREARPWLVTRLDQSPGVERPVPPFTTSTLQQEANRKFRFGARRTMRVAQSLYEGIDLNGERVGLITYMRTDSFTLAERALAEAREVITERYGSEYLPETPRRYKTSSKNAQEAHEAIRPTNLRRHPSEVRRYLNEDQFRLYEMIWKRTIACQMVPARIMWTNVEVSVDNLVFHARGKQVLFPGFIKAYVEGRDEPDGNNSDKESLLPNLTHGQEVSPEAVNALAQSTRPPSRYTEASLVKKLEEEGIGRPSTYATIITTIQERGYILKRGLELVPTFTAFCVTEFLEHHFPDLVDVGFTSGMEDQLDEIAAGKRDSTGYLRAFYLGAQDRQGLVSRVEEEEKKLEFPRIHVGEEPNGTPIVVKMGRFGPYIQRGEGGEGNFAPVPEDLAPADLTLEMALELLALRAAAPEVVTQDPETGRPITLQKGRFGPYLQLELTEEQKEKGEKPRRVSIPRELKDAVITPEIAERLILLPRTIGEHPEKGGPVLANIGRFGPYVNHGRDFRSVKSWEIACSISLEEALELLRQPKQSRRGVASMKVLKEFGELPDMGGPVRVLEGRYGPYITDGKTNAPLPKGTGVEELEAEDARQALIARAEAQAKKGKPRRSGRSGTKKAAEKNASKPARAAKAPSAKKAAKAPSAKKVAKAPSAKKAAKAPSAKKAAKAPSAKKAAKAPSSKKSAKAPTSPPK